MFVDLRLSALVASGPPLEERAPASVARLSDGRADDGNCGMRAVRAGAALPTGDLPLIVERRSVLGATNSHLNPQQQPRGWARI